MLLGLHSQLLAGWQLPFVFDAEEAADRVPDEPDVWTGGSLVQDRVSGTCFSGSGFFTHLPVIFGLDEGGAILMMMMLVETGQ